MTTEAGRAPCGARLAWDEVAVCSKHGVDCIDPDRLARALEVCPGPWPPNWTTETLAAAIVKAYEEAR